MRPGSMVCLCIVMPFDSSSGTQASWRRLGRAQPFDHTHDTGGVGAFCGLGCALPFDYVDGAVSRKCKEALS